MTTMQGSAPFKDDCARKQTRRRHARAAAPPELPDDVLDRLAALLPAAELEDALAGLEPDQITGPGGLITQLAGRVIEAALAAELSGHLGHPHGGVPEGANLRNGSTPKTLQTDVGPVAIRTPRDRDASFEPQLVKKRQTRLAGLDDRVLDLYAGGMSVRDIAAHVSELYGNPVGRRSAASPTPSWKTSRHGAHGRLMRSTPSCTSMRCR